MSWPKTENSCNAVFCGESIPYGEEVCLLTVEVAYNTEHGVVQTPVVATDGDYMYEPVFFCGDCWSSILEDLTSFVEDHPPINDEHDALICSVCGSGIRLGEVFGKLTEGEFQTPDRNPDDKSACIFTPFAKPPEVLCAPCVNIIETDVSEIWGDPLRQFNECAEGNWKRCWRHGCCADVTNSRCHCEGENEE